MVNLRSRGLLGFIFTILLCSWQSASAHHYYFGLSELNYNQKNQHLELIHQFTAHDVENLIAEQLQIRFSPEHPKYEQLIQTYFENNFIIAINQQPVKLKWIGLEVVSGQLFVYQESDKLQQLSPMVIKNRLLIDTYKNQVNTVNYQLNGHVSSLTFTKSKQVIAITKKN